MTDFPTRQLLQALNPKDLQLILYPTEQCNFRCTYCYEDFELGTMPAEVEQGVVNLIAERVKDLRSLQLSWFGGEPLVAKETLFRISETAQRLCADAGVAFGGGLTTNGYLLTPDVAQRLVALKQTQYQISLDGYGEAHDRTRKLMSGRGSFARIWANLLAMRDSSLEFGVTFRIHLTRHNTESIETLARHLRAEFLHDPRFNIYVKPIENLGGDGAVAESIPSAERAAIRARIDAAFADPAAVPADLPAPPPPPRAIPQVCYASRPNSLAIRADGRIQKCTVQLDQELNSVGRLRADGSLSLDRDKMALWMRGYAEQDADALRCPAQHISRHGQKIIPIRAIGA